MPDLKTKHVIAPLIQTADLPDDVLKAAEGEDIDKWFYATVEHEDREGDIVRVKGIDTVSYAQNGPIKFIMSHSQRPLADGSLPVLGKAVRWVTTMHKSLKVPALAVGIKFADTKLARETKSLYDGGFLSDVSIGFQPKKGKPLANGTDYEECAIGELSACVTGMNQFAGVLRALDEECKPAPAIDPAELTKQLTEAFGKLFADFSAKFNTRLDDLEDSLSELPKADAPQSDREMRQSRQIDLDRLRELLKS